MCFSSQHSKGLFRLKVADSFLISGSYVLMAMFSLTLTVKPVIFCVRAPICQREKDSASSTWIDLFKSLFNRSGICVLTIRPLKINCAFWVRNFLKSYERARQKHARSGKKRVAFSDIILKWAPVCEGHHGWYHPVWHLKYIMTLCSG